jgi:protein O-mannosyl-transferase
MKKRSDNRAFLLVGLLLIALTLIGFWQVLGNDFVNYDDDEYVTDNLQVQKGLTWEGTVWAFTKYHSANWHPLTWLSHMLDCQIWGLNAMGHHLTNLVLHILNTLLLFYLLSRMTGSVYRSGFVAALFAVHPLHVESVAWVAERKDVLSTFFLMLTLLAYAGNARDGGKSRYILVVLFYALGLMSKPMLVTLPLLLVMLDYWPLGRFETAKGARAVNRLLLEKVPFALLAAGSCVVTFIVQRSDGAVKALEGLTLGIRAANAVVAYVAYIIKMFWPAKLAVFYPHPENTLPGWQVIASAVVLVLITAVAIWFGRKRRYLMVGWLWYVVTLVPVIGFIQVGWQSMADRYTYIPLIGLFVIVAWGVPELLVFLGERTTRPREIRTSVLTPISISALVIVALTAATWLQVRYWENSRALFERAISVTTGNYVAHENLGLALDKEGLTEEAMAQYRKVIAIRPIFAEAYNNLGIALSKQGRNSEALDAYREVVKLRPEEPAGWFNMANALAMAGEFGGAEQAFREAVRLKPDFGDAHVGVAMALYMRGDYRQAWHYINEARRQGHTPPQPCVDALSEKMPESEYRKRKSE